jgi:hypothetical protein
MNNSKKSLVVRDEVINLIKEKFEMKFSFSYNDIYKVKDNFVIRRLKGSLGVKNNEGYYESEENKINEFNKLIIEIDNFVKNLDYKGFEIRLKKRVIYVEERDREYYEKCFNCIVSMKELRDIEVFNERELILSIKFKNN